MLELHGISIERGGRILIEGVNATLTAGHARVLRGPNGAGKTSLLRVVAGLAVPESGTLQIKADHVIYHGHENATKPQMTLLENLGFWAQIYGSDVSLDAALAAFDLTPLKERPAHFLSAGQKRRAGLARLMLCQGAGALWLLDEPTVSLDQASVALFSNVVTAHLDAGGAALIATHIDLGLEAEVLDLSQFLPKGARHLQGDEAFL